MGATNVISLAQLQEEEATNLQVPKTQLTAMAAVKSTGADVNMANQVMGLLWRAGDPPPDGVPDGLIRLPCGVEPPITGASINLPPGMCVDEKGRIQRDGVPLSDAELGGTTIRGGLCESQLEEEIEGLHQSVSSVCSSLKLCGMLTSIQGHVWRRPTADGKKAIPSLKLYLTNKPFIIEDYRAASTLGQLLVGASPELRDWLVRGETRIQNVASKLLFSLMEHDIKDVGVLVAERDALVSERNLLRNQVEICSKTLADSWQQFESDFCFRRALIKEMVKLSAKLSGSVAAQRANMACKDEDHFYAIEDNTKMLKVYRQLIALSAFTAITV